MDRIIAVCRQLVAASPALLEFVASLHRSAEGHSLLDWARTPEMKLADSPWSALASGLEPMVSRFPQQAAPPVPAAAATEPPGATPPDATAPDDGPERDPLKFGALIPTALSVIALAVVIVFWLVSTGRSPETVTQAAGAGPADVTASIGTEAGTQAEDPTRQTRDPEAAALEALRAAASQDRARIDRNLADRWTAQLSSKQAGLHAEGRTWGNVEILDEYRSLKSRYPDLVLAWSGDWSTFELPDWWVMLRGAPQSDTDDVLDWCRSEGYDRDHCLAKLLSNNQGAPGSTAMLPR